MSTNTAVQRVFNFSAGPAVLPVPVLEQIQTDRDEAFRFIAANLEQLDLHDRAYTRVLSVRHTGPVSISLRSSIASYVAALTDPVAFAPQETSKHRSKRCGRGRGGITILINKSSIARPTRAWFDVSVALGSSRTR